MRPGRGEFAGARTCSNPEEARHKANRRFNRRARLLSRRHGCHTWSTAEEAGQPGPGLGLRRVSANGTLGGQTVGQCVERIVNLLLVVTAPKDGPENYLLDVRRSDGAEFGSSKEGLDVIARTEPVPAEAFSWQG